MNIPLFQAISGRNPERQLSNAYSIPLNALPDKRTRAYNVLGLDADTAVTRCCRAIASQPRCRRKLIETGEVVFGRGMSSFSSDVLDPRLIGDTPVAAVEFDTPTPWAPIQGSLFFDEDTWTFSKDDVFGWLQGQHTKKLFGLKMVQEDDGTVVVYDENNLLPFKMYIWSSVADAGFSFEAECPFDDFSEKASELLQMDYGVAENLVGTDAAWLSLNKPHEFVAIYLTEEAVRHYG